MKTKEELLKELQEMTPEERRKYIKELLKDENLRKEIRSAFMFSEFMPAGLLPDKDEKMDEKEKLVAETVEKRYIVEGIVTVLVLIDLIAGIYLIVSFIVSSDPYKDPSSVSRNHLLFFLLLGISVLIILLFSVLYKVIPEIKLLRMKGYFRKKRN